MNIITLMAVGSCSHAGQLGSTHAVTLAPGPISFRAQIKSMETEPSSGDYSSGHFLKYLGEVKGEFAVKSKK